MNALYNILISLLFIVLLTSCDIAGRLDIVNRTEETVFYKYYTHNGNGDKDTVSIEVSGAEDENIATILMGFGHTWSKPQIKEYTDWIERIEMVTEEDTTVLTDKNEMFDFFVKRRKGPFHKIVKIVFE